jgi:class 3 adenylate cyclase
MKAMAGWKAESPAAYLPVDRLHALATGKALRDREQGAALFADVSGFTALTATLARDLGSKRGSEEITRLLNIVFDAITNEIHRYGGSVISFGGDAITGDRWAIANILTGLGDVAVEEHQHATACRYFTESMVINRELGDRLALAHLLEALSYLAVIQERPEHALRLVGAAASLRSALGAPLSPSEASRLNERLTPARAQLGARAAHATEAEGKMLSLDEAIQLAMGQETRGL